MNWKPSMHTIDPHQILRIEDRSGAPLEGAFVLLPKENVPDTCELNAPYRAEIIFHDPVGPLAFEMFFEVKPESRSLTGARQPSLAWSLIRGVRSSDQIIGRLYRIDNVERLKGHPRL